MMFLVVLADRFGLRLAAIADVPLGDLDFDLVADVGVDWAAGRAAFLASRLVLALAKLEPFDFTVFLVPLVFREAVDFLGTADEGVAEDASGGAASVLAAAGMAGGSLARAVRLAAFLVFLSSPLTTDRSAR